MAWMRLRTSPLGWALATAVLASLLFLGGPQNAHAANCSPTPNTFTNGTVADATQVNANFSNILTCANNNLAHNGPNSDITSLSGLTTALSVPQGGTGTTSIPNCPDTSGNHLNYSSPSFICGTSGAASVGLHAQAFTSSGSFTIPGTATSSTLFKFTVCGGGGGGGGANSTNNAGGGGASGTCAVSWFHGFTANQAVTIQIGSGGGSEGAGTVSALTYNSVGILNAGGGGAGTHASTTGVIAGGAPGTAGSSAGSSGLTLDASTVGSISGPGAAERGALGYGASAGSYSGQGGACWFGGGAPPTITASTQGANGTGYCSGGAGGLAGSSSVSGGSGSGGIVIVEWVL